jgi:hypothetical protein
MLDATQLDGTGADEALPPFARIPAPESRVAEPELRVGLSSIVVVALLGSPQMVTRGPDGREVWRWDRVSRRKLGPRSADAALLAGVGADAAAAVSVAVRFDADLRVSSVGVHAAA